jgi:hypothetical protein
MSFRVYIAAPWELQQDAKAFGAALEQAGVTVTASWLGAESEQLTDEWAWNCLRDIVTCDVLLAWNPEEWARIGTGGRHVEFGYALALFKTVIVVGARTNIFHHLQQIDHVAIDGDTVTNVLLAADRRGFSRSNTRVSTGRI